MSKKIIIGVFVLLAAIIGTSLYYAMTRRSAPTARVYRIGVLVRGSGYETAIEGYRRKMTELGYVEGKNVVYDVRFVSAKDDMSRAVQDFLREGVDLIHTYSTPATQVAYQVTKAAPHPVPVVFGSVGDSLIAGVVQDVRRPGTNVTGVTSLSTELTARRLELLHEINPKGLRIAMPRTDEQNGDLAANKSAQIAADTAAKLGMTMTFFPVRAQEDNASVASHILGKNFDGMIVGGDSLVWGSIDVYIAQAIKEKIPFAAFDLSQVHKGALVGFGPDYEVSGEQSAILTNQILRGRSPAEIPVEVPRKLLLVVNRKTARAIGFTFSDEFLRKADIVIDE